jgi:tetratricopeptide (TPR) repeat protein
LARGSNEGKAVDRARWTFGQLLDWHLLRGTRPSGKFDHPGRKWSAKAFADAVGFGDRTIRYWLRNEHLPPEIETIERVLFGHDACYAEWRLELRQAHARSWATKGGEIGPPPDSPSHGAGAGHVDPNPQARAALPASNIPIRVPTHFMGRGDALAAIETGLKRYEGRVAITALHGLRGVGKTTLAAAYAEWHRGDYRATWWIRAQSESSMRADLMALGIRLGWVGADDKEEPAVAATMERLRHEGDGILLIYDNAIDADALKPHLPRGGAARVLVTSNAHAWRGVAEPVEIRLWPKEIGADYLIARTGRDPERRAAEVLSEALGGLPLAHEQAAAYCERLAISLAEYGRRFMATPARLLDDERHAPAEYHDGLTVAKTFSLAIEEAAKLHPGAEPLIGHASLMAPEPIPLFLFSEAREKFGEPLATALAGDGLDEAVAALRTFALIDREAIVDERDPGITIETIRLHRLVREVAAARDAGRARADILANVVEAMATVYQVADDPKTWPRARRLDAPALALANGSSALPETAQAQAAKLLHGLAWYRYSYLGTYPQARLLCERALAIREKVLGSEHPDTARSLQLLAVISWDQGDCSGARPLCERALAIREKVLGPEHAAVASSLSQLARCLQDAGDLSGARPLLERALAISEKTLGPEHPVTADSLFFLARLLFIQGDLGGARLLCERSLAIREKVVGPDHHHTAWSLTVLADVIQAQGNPAGARPLVERALAIFENALGPEHPDTTFSLTALARVTLAGGDPAGARRLLERALTIREKALGPEHPATAGVLSELAIVLQAQNDLVGARLLFERALAALEKERGTEHHNTNRVRSLFARLLLAAGNVAQAVTCGDTALANHEKTLGKHHLWTKDSAAVTADALHAQGRTEEAAALRTRCGIEY